MQTLKSILNKRVGDSGGTEIGWSSLSAFHACEKRWALGELLPHPKGGFGIGARMAHPLFVGQRIHDAMKAWYLSDPTSMADWDGSPVTRRYSAEAGMEALREGGKRDKAAVENDEDWAKWSAEAEQLWRRYSAETGASGPDPETNYFVVAHDNEGPMVERFFAVPLGYQDYYMTTRLDTVGWAVDDLPTSKNPGTIVIPEHKTCDVSFRAATLADYGLSGQVSCEALAVKECLGFLGHVYPVINLIQKRSKGEKTLLSERGRTGELCRIWEPVDRSERDLLKFKIDMVRRLKRMNSLVEEYKEHVKLGVDPLDAIELVFDGHPERMTCAGQGFRCGMYDLCRNRQNAKALLLSTTPRFAAEADRTLAQEQLEGVL